MFVLGQAGDDDAEDEDAEDEDACLGPEVPILLTGIPSGDVALLALPGGEPTASGERRRFRSGARSGGGRVRLGERQVCLIVLDSERLPAALWRHSSQEGRIYRGGGLAGSPSGGDLGRLFLGVGLGLGTELELGLGLGLGLGEGLRLGLGLGSGLG